MQTREWKSSRGGPAEPGSAVGGDAQSWNALWRALGQPPPPLDLARFVGVAVYAGSRPTGGWKIVLDEPRARGEDLVVRYRIVKPSGFATQAFTQPWLVRAVVRPRGRVIVEAESE